MAGFLSDHVKLEPGLKEAVKVVIKYEIQSLLTKLADTGEEYLVLTASTLDKSCGHIGSLKGEGFVKNSSLQLLKEEFLQFCTGDQHSQSIQMDECNTTHANIKLEKKENPSSNRAHRRKSTPRCKSQPPEWQTQQELQEIQNYAMISEVDPIPTHSLPDNAENSEVLDLSDKNIGGYSYTLDCSNDSYSSNVMSSSSDLSRYPSKDESPKYEETTESNSDPIAYRWREEKIALNFDEIKAPTVEFINDIPAGFNGIDEKPSLAASYEGKGLNQIAGEMVNKKISKSPFSSQDNTPRQSRNRRKSRKVPVKVKKNASSVLPTPKAAHQKLANSNHVEFSEEKINANGLTKNVANITDMKSAFLEMGNMAKCLICFKVLANKNNRTFHWRSHVGDKRYTCDICNKAFTHPSNMRSHRKIHTDEKPFPCELCDRRFRRRDYLLQHLERFHYNPRPSETLLMNESYPECTSTKS